MGIHWKIWLSEERFHKKPIKRRDCIKSGAWIVFRFKGSLSRKSGWWFLRRGLIPQRILCFLNKLKGKGRPFFEGPKKGAALWDYSQEHIVVIREEKISPFVKFEVILHLRYFLLHLLTGKRCKAWSSMINFWIDSRTYQK